MSSEIDPHVLYPEAPLLFHPERRSDQDKHPLNGLLRFGPYSQSIMPSPIRVATLAPANESQKLFSFMRELHQKFQPVERNEYLPEWPGFHVVFQTKVTAADKKCRRELELDIDEAMKRAERPHVILAEHLIRAIQPLEACRSDFDVLFLYLPQRWQEGFAGKDDDFDLHDHLSV